MHFSDKRIALAVVVGIVVGLGAALLSLTGRMVGASDAVELGQSEADSCLTETLLFTRSLYLPLVGKNWQSLTETLKTKYVFVETHTVVDYDEKCGLAAVNSLPIFSFNPYDGILTVYSTSPFHKLEPDDMGYLGQWVAGGGYYANNLQKFHAVPFSADGLTLNTVQDDGTVSLEYLTTTITLAPQMEWLTRTVSQRPGTPTCIFTRTERITNYAFQERSKIVYVHGN